MGKPKSNEPNNKSYIGHRWNSNLLCAVDVETSGLDFEKHEITELAILPLDSGYVPSKYFKPFNILIQPENDYDPTLPQKMKDRYVRAKTHGMERWAAVDYLIDWFEKLHLPPGRGIIPLGCNYVFDRDFIRNFVGGRLTYYSMFRDDYRDVQLLAHYLDDIAEFNVVGELEFSFVSLRKLCLVLGVEQLPDKAHNAMYDCICTAQVWHKLLSRTVLFGKKEIAYSAISNTDTVPNKTGT